MTKWRDIGKRLVLGCGYNMSGKRFSELLANSRVRLSEDKDRHVAVATDYVRIYRDRFPRIREYWKKCGEMLRTLCLASLGAEGWPERFVHPPFFRVDAALEVGGGLRAPAVVLPNGYPIVYRGLRTTDGEFFMDVTKYRQVQAHKIYGGSVTAHLTQGSAFAAIARQGLAIAERYRVVGNSHDKWIILVPEGEEDEATRHVESCLRTPPKWLEGLPLNCEVVRGKTYEIAKDREGS
jgi:hypothetical protein